VPTFKLTIAYDGTDFVGWQRQPSGLSIQGVLEEALSDLDGRGVSVIGAGRTDAGVHARGQVAAVTLSRRIAAEALTRATNIRLPGSVRILAAAEVGSDFHARFHARAKRYQYRIWNADVLSPFERAYAWHVPMPLDRSAMAEAAARLTGTHDFAAFQGTGSDTLTTTRTITASSIVAADELVCYHAAGEGFLRHMVRNIVGTLVEVGRGHRPPAWISEVLAARDRSQAGPTAPPQGLFLMEVAYDE
jgi:tRNA pseudouridine38-40 synthase